MRHGDRITIGESEFVFLTGNEDDAGEPPVYLDETPIALTQSVVEPRSDALVATLLRFIDALRNARESHTIREKLLEFVFGICPADRRPSYL